MYAIYIAMVAISVAIAAQILAIFAIDKALREIDKLSASRLSRSSASLTDNQDEAKS